MIQIPGFALVHRARVVRVERAGERDAQGERAPAEILGPWFPARRMSPRPSEGDDDGGGRRRQEVRFQLLYGDEYEDGSLLVDPPQASDMVDVEVREVVARYTVTNPRDLDTGTDVIGGEVDIVAVGDSS